MREPLWRQRLRRAQASRQDSDDGSSPGADLAADRDTQGPTPPPGEVRARLRDLQTPGGERRDAYAAWAERMKTHKKEKLASVVEESAPGPGGPADGPSVYWDSEMLFGEARRVETGDDPRLMSDSDLLAMLGLHGGATAREVQVAYRQAAKLHHPDRWVEAVAEVQQEHADQMTRIATAYQTLKERGR